MIKQVHQLLEDIQYGTMSSLAYDTAWGARLGDIDRDLRSQNLEWLYKNQLPDGSWGAEKPFYYHDRVISTLAALIALSQRPDKAMDRKMIERGLFALEKITGEGAQGLKADANRATVGFEMIVPTLVAEAERLGLIKQQGDRILAPLAKMRSQKMARLNGTLINRYMTPAFSFEMAGMDGLDKFDIDNLQESNGSIGHSPSATAFFALNVKSGDSRALDYLHSATAPDGGLCNLYPFEIFERAWILWNLSLVPIWDKETLGLMRPHLDYLRGSWKTGKGVALSALSCVPEDADDTIFAYDILNKFHYKVDIESVLSFEEGDHFRCYESEVGLSPSVNIHAMIALRHIGYEASHPRIQRILRFLDGLRNRNPYWTDKWNVSPFYTTSHFIIACAGYQNNLAYPGMSWILSNQRKDGSWGFFMPTAEETSYCLQALCVWEKETGISYKDAIQKGYKWLKGHFEETFPPLWLGKGLYRPDLIVRSAILSAMVLVENRS